MPKPIYYTYRGEHLSIKALAQRYGIEMRTLHYRLRTSGWDIAKALETPIEDHRLTSGTMRWCPTHELAWCQEPIYEQESYWHPIPRTMLAYALAYAKAFGCAGQIVITEAACDRCAQEGGMHAS